MPKNIARIRFFIQSAFFALAAAPFAGLALPAAVAVFYNSLHLLPCLSASGPESDKFFWPLAITVAALPLFAGRFYCSFLCPAGFVQDLAFALSRRLGLSARAASVYSSFRIFIVFSCAFAAAFGVSAYWGWLDHITIFARTMETIVAPFFAALLSPLSKTLSASGFLDSVPRAFEPGGVFAFVLSFALFAAAASLLRPRWFCATLCPSGAFYVTVLRVAFIDIVKAPSCNACGACEKRCPALCIVKGDIDRDLCVTCFECVAACPSRSLAVRHDYPFELPEAPPAGANGDSIATNGSEIPATSGGTLKEAEKTRDKNDNVPNEAVTAKGGAVENASAFGAGAAPASAGPDLNEGRRRMLKLFSAACAGVALAGVTRRFVVFYPGFKTSRIMPPGAMSAANFYSKCSACHLCVAACPTRIIKPDGAGNGLAGFMRPALDFSAGYCPEDCIECSAVCPTGALAGQRPAAKRNLVIGLVAIDSGPKTECVAYRDGTECGACAEGCPTGAIYMKNENGVMVPRTWRRFCIGCGLCESLCPVAPEKRPIRIVPVQRQVAMRPMTAADRERAREDAGTAGVKVQKRPGDGTFELLRSLGVDIENDHKK